MSDNPIVDPLRHLVTVNNDADAGFRTAAQNVRNSEIETVLEGYAARHASFAAELQAELEHTGEKPPDSGTIGSSLHRGWLDLKATLTGHSVKGMLSACKDVEQNAESAYLDALEVITSGKLHTLLEKQCEQIKGFRARLARLVSEIEDGLHFQKNE